MNNINDLMENARLKGRVISLEAQLESERAEVERLNTGIQPEGNNDAVGRAVNVLLEKEKEIARLKAEVERLRKSGDAMGCLVNPSKVAQYLPKPPKEEKK